MVRKNEQCSAADAPKNDINGTLRHVDPADLPAPTVINEDLAVRNIYVALLVDGDTFTAALGKGM